MPYFINKKEKTNLRRSLRTTMPKGERILWGKLRNNQINGFKFKRQVDLGSYVVDFYCHELKLIIEIDGLSHDNKETYKKDIQRQKYLENRGFTIKRYTSDDVFNKLQNVLNDINNTCEKLGNNDSSFNLHP